VGAVAGELVVGGGAYVEVEVSLKSSIAAWSLVIGLKSLGWIPGG